MNRTLIIGVVAISTFMAAPRTWAQTTQEQPAAHDQQMPPGMVMPDPQQPATASPPPSDTSMAGMDMGTMQSSKPAADARETDAYSDGYVNSTLPGYEMADRLSVSKVLIDEAEFTTNNQGQGFSWSGAISNGPDNNKLWLRSQGLKQAGEQLDPESSVEAMWWHAQRPYWGSLVGVRQDIGPGAHRWLAAGIEGLAPYWFDIQLTGYVGDDGRLAARLKATYDVLLTNRLIATPQLETNVYSKSSNDRRLGAGLSNLELGLRIRYEVERKIAPYIGFVWERSFGKTADFRRAVGENPTERRFVAGFRIWW